MFSPQKDCVKIKVFNRRPAFFLLCCLLIVIYVIDSCILLISHRQHSISSTVRLKGKLTVSTRSSKLDSLCREGRETFEFRDARVEDRESRNEEFWNIHELEIAIHL